MPAKPVSTKVLFTNPGTFYQYTGEEEDRPYYEPLGDADSFTISVLRREGTPDAAGSGTSRVEYIIEVSEDEEKIFEQAIGINNELSYSDPAASVHWPAIIDGNVEKVAFRFAAPETHEAQVTARMRLQQFVELYNRCTYSLLTGHEELDPEDEWYQYLGGATTREVLNEDATNVVLEFDAGHLARTNTGTGNICAVESLQFDRFLVVKKSNEKASLEMQTVPQKREASTERRWKSSSCTASTTPPPVPFWRTATLKCCSLAAATRRCNDWISHAASW
ncbi:hypothetical protein JKF63_05465 [Porcisia hertigi]|uniref:Uncharacterized protein n=1 Tax=Porcisia hertigi TaxID=2761500 RepID=A0A836IEZ4_9TRYP|nr:hypothetical protein JKF63_05465 [Porcisia hertigi]